MVARAPVAIFAPARVMALLLAAGSLGWAAFVLATPRPDRTKSVARAILGGERFEGATLARFTADLGPAPEGCASAAGLRDRLVVTAAATDAAFGRGAVEAYDAGLDGIDRLARDLLACWPRDSFAWLSLFWVASRRDGLGERAIADLRRSYLYGPREGWIALHRSRLALARYGLLPPDLKVRAVEEYVELLKARFVSDAAAILAATAPPVRDLVLASLTDVPLETKKVLAWLLARHEIDAPIPGLPAKPDRPWRN